MTVVDNAKDCLLIIDVQNDFCTGGALAVPSGEEVVEVINRLGAQFEHKILTQDWHPAGHASFASSHAGKSPYDMTTLVYGEQILWPDHCVQGTQGAAFHCALEVDSTELVIRKGFRPHIDSYSAFFENDKTTPTGLTRYLKTRGLQKLYLTGLATDFCVAFSALDAKSEGFDVVLIEDACRAIDLNGSLADMKANMLDAGVLFKQSNEMGA
ncbi:MAG: bifunctional nicotinamidase/pyrazinamidase [Arenicellales bacterium WSBS_2016_MAG_OTU3]